MKHAGPIEILIEITKKNRDQAAAELGAALAEQRQTEDKLAVLEGYLADYQSRARLARSTDASRLANLRAFTAQLESALAQQRAICAQAADRVAATRAGWERELRRERAYGSIVERRASAARLVDRRAQQKQQDEFAARAPRSAAYSA
ncbi:MAG: flagellar export protein FliJ [Betaproteobacteria bacterium]|nr:flagellar export protein FliJ [Betaproteobacteria bacterium]